MVKRIYFSILYNKIVWGGSECVVTLVSEDCFEDWVWVYHWPPSWQLWRSDNSYLGNDRRSPSGAFSGQIKQQPPCIGVIDWANTINLRIQGSSRELHLKVQYTCIWVISSIRNKTKKQKTRTADRHGMRSEKQLCLLSWLNGKENPHHILCVGLD